MDPLICISAAAACTERIKLGTHILVVPLRHPVLLAKEIATLDYISGGRFFFGVGPGWSKPEFDAMGIDIRERGRRTDEILDAVKLLLTEKNVSFKGEFFQFDDVTIDPMPPKFPGGLGRRRLAHSRQAVAGQALHGEDRDAAHRQARRCLHLPRLGQAGVGQAGFRDGQRVPAVGRGGTRPPWASPTCRPSTWWTPRTPRRRCGSSGPTSSA